MLTHCPIPYLYVSMCTQKGVVTDSYGGGADDSSTEDDNADGDDEDYEDDGGGSGRGGAVGATGGKAGGGDASARSFRTQSDNNFEGCYDHAVGDEVGDERYSSEDETKLSGIDGGGGGGDGRGRNRGSSR